MSLAVENQALRQDRTDVPTCPAAQLSRVTFGQTWNSECVDETGFSFFLITEVPTQSTMQQMCGVAGCQMTMQRIRNVTASDCVLASGLQLYKDILDPIQNQCIGFSRSTENEDGTLVRVPIANLQRPVSSSQTTTPKPAQLKPVERGVQGTAPVESVSGSSSSSLGAGPIAGIIIAAVAFGLLLAFVVSRRQRLRRKSLTGDESETSNYSQLHDDSSALPCDEVDTYASQRQQDAFVSMRKPSLAVSRASTESLGSYTDMSVLGSMAADTVDDPLLDHPVLAPFRIPYANVRVVEMLSRGKQSEVYHGTFQNEKVAIKKLRYERRDNSLDLERLLTKAAAMAAVQHERLAALVCVTWDAVMHDLGVVTPYSAKGDLRALLDTFVRQHRSAGFDAEKLRILLHVAEALQCLHSSDAGYVHGHLRSTNVLLTPELDAVVTSFGLPFDPTTGTPSISVAPEVLEGQLFTSKADVYSFGVLLVEMCTHRFPTAESLVNGVTDPEMALLTQQCLATNPDDRPTAGEIVQRITVALHSCSS